MLAGVVGWDTVGGKKVEGEDLYDPLRMRSEQKGRSEQVFCYTAGDEAEGFGSGEE